MGAFEAPIFSAGRWGNRDWSSADLDRIVANFNLLKGKIDPPIRFGHSDTQPFNEAEQPAAGWLDGVRRDGDKLIGSFANVPTIVQDAIKQRLYPKLSAEIYHSFENHPAEQNLKSGATGPTLKAVALLGQTPPVVKNLGDLSNYLHGEGAGDLTLEFSEPLVVDGPQEPRGVVGDAPAVPSAAAIADVVLAKLAERFPTLAHPRDESPAPGGAKEHGMTDAEKADLLAQFDERMKPLETQITQLAEAKTKAEGEITKLAEENARIKDDNARLAGQVSKAEAERTHLTAIKFAEDRCSRENLRMYPTQKPAGIALYERLNASEPIVSAEEAKTLGLKNEAPYTARDLFSEFVDQHPATKLGTELSVVKADKAPADELTALMSEIATERKLDLKNYDHRTEALLEAAKRRPELVEQAA